MAEDHGKKFEVRKDEGLVGMDDQNHPRLDAREAAIVALEGFDRRMVAGCNGVKRLPRLDLVPDRSDFCRSRSFRFCL